MQGLKTVISIFLKKYNLEAGLAQQQALVVWGDVVGEKISKKTSAESIEHGVLIVKTKSSPWRQELNMQKKDIIIKLNKKLNQKTIKDIRFL